MKYNLNFLKKFRLNYNTNINLHFSYYISLDPCDQTKESGPCEGNFTRWYFNAESQACEQFLYGGCKGNDNNFPTEIACHQQCLQPGRRRGMFIHSNLFYSTSARITLVFLPETIFLLYNNILII